MEFTNFEESNFYLGAGDNPNTVGIPACLCQDPITNKDFIFGKVKFNQEELNEIARTGEIYIGVMGRGWPPMLPTAWNPFTEFPKDQCFKVYDLKG